MAIKPEDDKRYPAFEVVGWLYQFRRITFRVSNGMANLKRIIDKIITDKKLEGTFAYIDNVTVCGHDQKDHLENLRGFMDTVNRYNPSLNNEKCSFGQNIINLLG